MQRHHSYPYSFAAPSATRYSSSHNTSSAQSASANPDEDWTKISDLAERRRIQNRIAQRNYRKKLKRRLEDLERRAGSSSASPEQQHAEILPSQNPRPNDPTKKRRASKPGVNPPRTSRSPIAPQTPSFSPRDDQSSMFSRQYTRQLSASPPPAFTYTQFPTAEPPPIQAPYPQHAPFHTLPAPYPDFQSQPLYLPPLPMTRPNGNSYDGAPVKSENNFNDDEMISHFNMSYSSISGIEVPTTQSYADSNAYVNNPEYSFQLPFFSFYLHPFLLTQISRLTRASPSIFYFLIARTQQLDTRLANHSLQTPPLSLSNSFDHSRATSPSEQSMMCPQTPPVSLPLSRLVAGC